MEKIRKVAALIIGIIQVFSSCENLSTNSSKATYRKDIINNQIIEGYYDSLNRPTDTLNGYSLEHQHLWQKSYKDGVQYGPTLKYYPNGIVSQRVNYSNNKMNGEYLSYFESGKLKSYGFAFDDQLQGDRYHYYESGTLRGYNFLDFSGRNLIVQHFDSITAKRIENEGEVGHYDTLYFNDELVVLNFLLSHPPFSKNQIILEHLDSKEQLIRVEKIPDSGRVFNLTWKRDTTISFINLKVLRYDSISRTQSGYLIQHELSKD